MCEVVEDEASTFETQRSAHNTPRCERTPELGGLKLPPKARSQRRIIQLSFGSRTA